MVDPNITIIKDDDNKLVMVVDGNKGRAEGFTFEYLDHLMACYQGFESEGDKSECKNLINIIQHNLLVVFRYARIAPNISAKNLGMTKLLNESINKLHGIAMDYESKYGKKDIYYILQQEIKSATSNKNEPEETECDKSVIRDLLMLFRYGDIAPNIDTFEHRMVGDFNKSIDALLKYAMSFSSRLFNKITFSGCIREEIRRGENKAQQPHWTNQVSPIAGLL